EQRSARLDARRDVEEHELVGALGRVAGGELGRIALVDQVDEAGALDDAPGCDVEARDDTATEHAQFPPLVPPAPTGEYSAPRPADSAAAQRTKFASTRRPSPPDRSGWNWTPRTFSRSIADTNGLPWRVSARTAASPASPSGRPAYE